MKLDICDVKDIIVSIVCCIIISSIFVFLFALILSVANIPDGAVMPINIGIKIISILLGCFIGFKKMNFGLIKGLLIGIFYSLVLYLVYSIVNKDFSLNTYTIFDILACIFSAVISGITVVNVKKVKCA